MGRFVVLAFAASLFGLFGCAVESSPEPTSSTASPVEKCKDKKNGDKDCPPVLTSCPVNANDWPAGGACAEPLVCDYPDACGNVNQWHCKYGSWQINTWYACPPPPACTSHFQGGETSCKSVETWKLYASDDCTRQGKTLTEYTLGEPCGDGVYRGVTYTCCP